MHIFLLRKSPRDLETGRVESFRIWELQRRRPGGFKRSMLPGLDMPTVGAYIAQVRLVVAVKCKSRKAMSGVAERSCRCVFVRSGVESDEL